MTWIIDIIDAQTLERVHQFHRHMCPGLAMGIRAAEIALERIGPHAGDEDVVASVETDMTAEQLCTPCFDDAIAGRSPLPIPTLGHPDG